LRVKHRYITVIVGTAVLLSLLFPHVLGALEVTTTTGRPNGLAQTGIVGGKPTRVTWEADTGSVEGITQLTFALPEGTDLSGVTVNAVVLDGVNKTDIATMFEVDGQEVRVELIPAIESDSHLRVLLGNVTFSASGGPMVITATAQSQTGLSESVESPPIQVATASLTERIIAYLDGAAWVGKWNSVPILNMFFKPQMIAAGIRTQFTGWLRAVGLVALGFPLAIPIGLALAFIRISRLTPLKWLAAIYINIIRGTPLFLQIYIAFFGLPLIGVQLNDYLLGCLVLAVNSSAYLAEIFRAGIQSIHKGQFEAAASLGMSYPKQMLFVIIPQTIRRVLPTMTSEFILLYKDTSLLAAVGVMELMLFSKTLVSSTGNVTPYVVAALYYMLVTLPLIKFVQMFEEKLAQSESGSMVPEKKKTKTKLWQRAPLTLPNSDKDLANQVAMADARAMQGSVIHE
jgi:polar amino acid transport system substrate-binding protein